MEKFKVEMTEAEMLLVLDALDKQRDLYVVPSEKKAALASLWDRLTDIHEGR